MIRVVSPLLAGEYWCTRVQSCLGQLVFHGEERLLLDREDVC